ncbi:MAG: hypothetical protein AAF146_19305 [Bacteroidota bacterium]
MKFTRIFFLLLLCCSVLMTSCRKEELSEEIQTEQEITPEVRSNNKLVQNVEVESASSSENGLDLGCFSINLPFGLVVDGVESTINTVEDFEATLANGGEYIDFAYPITITLLDGTTESIADGVELGEAFASCVPDGGWNEDRFPAYLICDLNSCYQLNYPVDLVDGEGNTYQANSEEAFIELIVEIPELYFVFPISLTDENGAIITAESEEDLFILLASCEEVYDPGTDTTNIFDGFFAGCYDIVYPTQVVDMDGNLITVETEDDLFNLLLNGGFVDFAFPLSLVDEEGNVVVVNDHEELCELVEACVGGGSGGSGGGPGDPIDGLDATLFVLASTIGGEDCYELVYPFTVTNADGTLTQSINNEAEALAFIQNNPPNSNPFLIDLPLEIKRVDTGEVVTINTIEDFILILENCG